MIKYFFIIIQFIRNIYGYYKKSELWNYIFLYYNGTELKKKGSAKMGNLGEALREELNCESAFTIGGIGISESVVVTWIIMAAVLVLSLLLTRKLKVEHPS